MIPSTELWIDPHSTLEVRNGSTRTLGKRNFLTGIVGLQRLKRRRSRLWQRRRVFFDHRKRFADAGSERVSDLAQARQDVFFSCSLRLLLIKKIS